MIHTRRFNSTTPEIIKAQAANIPPQIILCKGFLTSLHHVKNGYIALKNLLVINSAVN